MSDLHRVTNLASLGLLLFVWLSAGCGGNKDPGPPLRPPDGLDVLARVGDEVITENTYRAEAVRRAVAGNNETAKKLLLNEMVNDLRLLQRAREKGYDRDPAIVRQYQTLLISRAREDFLHEDDPLTHAVADDKETRAYYDAHSADYAVPVRVRAAMIFVATPAGMNPEALATKQHKMEEARRAIVAANLLPAANFGGLAATYTEDQDTRYIGGDLGYQIPGMTNFSTDPAVESALFALEVPGKLSNTITGKDGLYLFKLMERDPASTLPFSKVQGRIRSELYVTQRKRAESALADALQAVPAEIHAEKLPGVSISIPPAAEHAPNQPPAVPGRSRR